MSKINVIAAMNELSYIGKDGKLLYRIKADLQNFKKLTFGKTVIMGRKTYEEIGKALPGRRNIVLSKKSYILREGIEMFSSLEEAIIDCLKKDEEVFIIGGGSIYKEALNYADKVYLTRVMDHEKGDTVFPFFYLLANFEKVNSKSHLLYQDGFQFYFEEYVSNK